MAEVIRDTLYLTLETRHSNLSDGCGADFNLNKVLDAEFQDTALF